MVSCVDPQRTVALAPGSALAWDFLPQLTSQRVSTPPADFSLPGEAIYIRSRRDLSPRSYRNVRAAHAAPPKRAPKWS